MTASDGLLELKCAVVYLSGIDQSWHQVLAPLEHRITFILEKLKNESFLPDEKLIFRALLLPADQVKAIILGQDPYPTPGMAEGLAFSVPETVEVLPPSLRNIFSEYQDDLSLARPTSGDLSQWGKQGVLLLNQILTVAPGQPLSHKDLGWQQVTDAVLAMLSRQGSPIICWDNRAYRAAVRAGFAGDQILASPHPSPLSAYRGFFGSKPFSRTNDYLREQDIEPIDWNLGR